MRRIAVINQKGGVGKTTTCANLGAALALQGRRVVVVDMDAQANLSLTLGIEIPSDSPSSYTVLTSATSFKQALRKTAIPGLSLVASNLDLSGAELELAGAIGREFLLRDALKTWEEEARAKHKHAPADYVLFDCPPSLGLLSINALAAAGEVLITIQTEFLALQGMSKLVEIVQLLRKRLNPELTITGILPCLYDSRLRLAREVLGEIRSFFPGQVLPRPIRANVKLAEAPSYGKTIFEYAPGSNGADDYLRAAEELLRQETRDPELAGLPAFTLDVALPASAIDASSNHPTQATNAPTKSNRRPPPPRPKKQPAPPAEPARTESHAEIVVPHARPKKPAPATHATNADASTEATQSKATVKPATAHTTPPTAPPTAKRATQDTTPPAAKSVTEPATAPTAKAPTQPTTQPRTKSVTDQATPPTAKSDTRHTAQHVTHPAAKSAQQQREIAEPHSERVRHSAPSRVGHSDKKPAATSKTQHSEMKRAEPSMHAPVAAHVSAAPAKHGAGSPKPRVRAEDLPPDAFEILSSLDDPR